MLVPLLVWVPSSAFVVFAVAAHLLDPRLFDVPLSGMRDGLYPVLGYAAFAALILAILGYARVLFLVPALRRFAVGPLVAAVLLVGVTLTPTLTTFHDGLAAAVLLLVTVFFAARWLDVSVALVVGVLAGMLTVAGVLLFVSPPWAQKVLVACQVVAMNADAMRLGRITTPRRGTSGR